MFTVVEFKEENKDRFYLKRLLRKPKPQLSEITAENGVSFYICKAEVRKGKIPYKEIKALSPKEIFLLPFDVTEKPPLKVFVPEKLPQLMLFNTALEYIKEKECPPTKTRITVVDKKGLYVDFFKEVIKLASHIVVVTKDESYRHLSDKLLDSYGVSLIIREKLYEDKGENKFLIDYEGEDVPVSYEGTVFSKNKIHLLNGKSLTPGGFDLPQKYESLRSKSINKLHFASALYELSGVKNLENLRFNELCS